MQLEINDTDWQLRAECRGPGADLFYPPAVGETREERRRRERHAKAICARCAVLVECRTYALSTEEPHGVWGGLTELERRAVGAETNPL
ncbi:MAG: WhiB family transcriptional regulator [Acidimicrobiia bacterium]